jgi:hypothetical protein
MLLLGLLVPLLVRALVADCVNAARKLTRWRRGGFY